VDAVTDKSVLDTPITLADAARLIGRSKQWVNTLERRGYIRKLDRGLYAAADVVQGYARSIAEDKRSTEKSAAEARLIEAKARSLELRTQREQGALAPLQEWYDGMSMITGKVVAALVGLPARFTRDIGERQRLETEINRIRTDVADWLETEGARLEEAARKSARRRV
jgi:phage terminase Nu1 subunit (DNA packaging protein)